MKLLNDQAATQERRQTTGQKTKRTSNPVAASKSASHEDSAIEDESTDICTASADFGLCTNVPVAAYPKHCPDLKRKESFNKSAKAVAVSVKIVLRKLVSICRSRWTRFF